MAEIVKLLLAGVQVERSGHGLDEPAEPAAPATPQAANNVQVNIGLESALAAARQLVAERARQQAPAALPDARATDAQQAPDAAGPGPTPGSDG
jgi:hypothetical protein